MNRKVEKSMLERIIEEKLRESVKKKKGLCLKFISPSMTGLPDRMVLLPKGKIGFIEVKRPGKRPRPIQVKRIKELRDLGFKVFIMDDRKDIDRLIEIIGGD